MRPLIGVSILGYGVEPIVSVVIPAFNASCYIGETVASVLTQTMAALEVIVIDDGSADSTGAIVRAISDDRVRLLSRSNGGVSAARNAGIREARARRFVAFLDADDCWDAEKLQRQIAFLNEHPTSVVTGCLMRYLSSTGRILGRSGHVVTAADRRAIAQAELFPFPTSSFLVRRDVLETVGGFDESLGRPSGGAEDLDLLARLAQAGEVACVPSILGSYRIHPGSAMARDRLRINREARFVRRRLAVRSKGGDLTREAFAATCPETWRERRQDCVELAYRTAALWFGEGRPLKALRYGALAAVVDPFYTYRRLHLQWLGRAGRLARRATAT